MTNKQQKRFVRKQQTVYYHMADQPSEVELASSFYTHMFSQDVSLGILPASCFTAKPNFKVTILPENDDVETVIRQGLADDRFNDSLANALYYFFYPLAASLCVTDTVTYEIVYIEDSQTNKPVGFELNPLAKKQLVKKQGMLYQIVPQEIAKEKNLPELIPLEDDIIEFRPPVNFASELQDMRANLRQLDKMQNSSVTVDAIKSQNTSYDFAVHQRSMKLALVETVKSIGWNARGLFNDSVMSYYWIRMGFTFEKFKIQLREIMLASLNTGLLQIGKKLGFEAQIKIEGLPTIADVNAASVNLDSGKMAFTEVMKPFNLQ